MAKKIVVEIDENGNINAETFDMEGVDCLTELDKLLKDIALSKNITKKPDFYKEKKTVDNTIAVKKS